MNRRLLAEGLGSLLLAAALRRELGPGQAAAYAAVQVASCCSGAALANLMFELPAIEASTQVRAGPAQWLSEFVATSGLVLVVFSSPSVREAAWRVAAWIGAAYWFTASTSFANPAITVARSLSDTFAGIRPADVLPFVLAQFAGGLAGLLIARRLATAGPQAQNV